MAQAQTRKKRQTSQKRASLRGMARGVVLRLRLARTSCLHGRIVAVAFQFTVRAGGRRRNLGKNGSAGSGRAWSA